MSRFLVAILLFLSLFVFAGISQTNPAPEGVDSHVGAGYEALKQDRYEDAMREFRAALALDPTLVERAQFPLGVALFESHQYSDARKELEAVRKVVGDHPNVLYYLGRMELESGQVDLAIRDLSKAAVKPPLPDTAYYLGFAYAQKGDSVSAEKWLKEAERATPQDARVPFQLGTLYRKLGRGEDARKALARSGELRKRDNDEVQMRVECAQKLDQGPRQEARAFCDKLYDPNSAEKLTKLGTLYGEHGDVEAALKPLQRAAELAPQSPQMQYNLAFAYFQLGQFEAARAPLELALKRWPDLFPLNSLYGAVLFRMGRFDAAYQALGRAHKLNSQDQTTREMLYATAFALAGQHAEKAQFAEAIPFLQQAAKLKPAEAEPHQRLAEYYAKANRPADAEAERKEAARLAAQ
ncbi:MAG TPA: tetratricopeptide repeat protein [Terriglobales bacterium]|nr:tetratricopeptide repeat protein [Terriglobales bacterium]